LVVFEQQPQSLEGVAVVAHVPGHRFAGTTGLTSELAAVDDEVLVADGAAPSP
jgi:hypothetical protein